MSITFSEKIVSRTLAAGGQNDYTIEAIAFCDGGEDQDAVLVAACADTTTFPEERSITLPSGDTSTYIRETIRVAPMETGKSNGQPERFEVSVPYVVLGRSNQPYITGDFSSSFSIGTQSVNIKVSKGTTPYPSSGTPDHKHSIGVTDDGVEGVGKDFPTYQFSETHYFDATDITDAYKAALYAVANSPLNSASFKGFAAGEVKFLGVEGTERHRGGDWELTFKFAASPNKTGISIGTITGIACKGWQYLWVYFKEDVDATTHTRVVTPKYVYVEDIYDSSDFSTLGIGT